MNIVCISEVVFDQTCVIKFLAHFHDRSLFVSKEFRVATAPDSSSAALTIVVIDVPLVLHFDVSAIPRDFAFDVLNKVAV